RGAFPGRAVAGGESGPPARVRGVLHRHAGRDGATSGRQPGDSPRADHDPRGDGARVLGTIPGARRVGGGDEAVPVHDAPGKPLRPVGPAGADRARRGAPGSPGAGRQARASHDRRRRAGNRGGEAQIVPRSRATRRIVRARLPLAHGRIPRSMTTASNLLAFLGLLITLLIVWRQSWPARLRLFVAQSLLLAALASTVGVLAQRRGLLLVAAVVVVVKGLIIPRVLARIGAGTAVRPVAPGRSSGITLLVAGGLVEAGVFLDVLVIVLIMEAVVVQVRREHDSIDVDRLRELRG